MEKATMRSNDEMVLEKELQPVEEMTPTEMLREIVLFTREARALLIAFEQFGKMGPAKALMSIMGGKQ